MTTKISALLIQNFVRRTFAVSYEADENVFVRTRINWHCPQFVEARDIELRHTCTPEYFCY